MEMESPPEQAQPPAAQSGLGEEKRLELALDYTWNWFEYHATQRLITFRYFLVVVGILLVAYSTAVRERWGWVGITVGALGVAVSLSFSQLDIRNRELVEYARVELSRFEERLGLMLRRADLERSQLRESGGWLFRWLYDRLPEARRPSSFKHGKAFRRLEGLSALVFVAGIVWAVFTYPGISAEPPAERSPTTRVNPKQRSDDVRNPRPPKPRPTRGSTKDSGR